MEPYVTASTISTSTSADMPIATATAVPVGEPYVATTATASSSTKKKKKKKKKGTAAGGTGGDVELAGVSSSSSLQKPKSIKKKKTAATATTDGDVEFTDVSSSGKKPKSSSSKKPKSIRKKKKKKDSPSSMSTVYDNTPKSHPVLKASGWNQVTAREINSNAYASDDASDPTKHKYAITGKESQIVTVLLEPNETCQGEPGSMMYLSGGVSMNANCGSDCFGRCCGGESCCVLNFTNNDRDGKAQYAALVTNEPLAKIVPIDMSSKEVSGSLIVQQGAYMASYGDVRIGFSCDCNFVRCCCGGMGLVRQKIEGTGTAFLGATGTIVQKVLEENEIMLMDTNCILAYSETCTFDLKRTGGLVGMIGGGEGIFNSSLKGPGLVIVQSMNMKLMLESLAAEKMYRR